MTTVTFYSSTAFRDISITLEADVYEGCPPSTGAYGEPLDQGDAPDVSYHKVCVGGVEMDWGTAAKLFGISKQTFIDICDEEIWGAYEQESDLSELPF